MPPSSCRPSTSAPALVEDMAPRPWLLVDGARNAAIGVEVAGKKRKPLVRGEAGTRTPELASRSRDHRISSERRRSYTALDEHESPKCPRRIDPPARREGSPRRVHGIDGCATRLQSRSQGRLCNPGAEGGAADPPVSEETRPRGARARRPRTPARWRRAPGAQTIAHRRTVSPAVFQTSRRRLSRCQGVPGEAAASTWIVRMRMVGGTRGSGGSSVAIE